MTDRLKLFPSSRLPKVLAVSLILTLAACAEEDPMQFVQEGNSLSAKDDVESARVQFRNALQINPKLAEAYYGLALLDEKKQDWKAMFANLQETVSIDPNHVNARVKLGQLYMLQGQLEQAKEQAASALKLAPENVDAMIFQSAVFFREGKNPEALEQINRVLAKDANNADAVISKATILFTEKNNDEALALAQKGIDAHPDNAGLRLLKIRFQTELKQYDDAVNEFAQLIDQHPEDKGLRNSQIDLLVAVGKAEQAEQALRDAIAKHPDDVDFKLKLVALLERRDPEQAEAALKAYVAERPTDMQLKSRFARFYADRGRAEDELAVLNQIVAADANGKEGMAAKTRLAELAWGKNDKASAEKQVAEVLAADGNNSEALLLRSGLRLDNNDADGAISDLRIVLRDRPNSDRAMAMMAQAYMMKGEQEVAESHWRKALEVNPANMSALMPITGQLLKRNDVQRAQELVDKAVKAAPTNPAVIELMIQVKAAQKDWAGAEAALAELKKMPQSQLAGELWSGLIAAERGEYEAALGHYKAVLDKQPNLARAWGALANAYQASGKSKELTAYLNGFIQSHPDSLQAYSLLASAYAEQKQWDDAEKTLRQALEKAPDEMELKLRLAALVERRDPEAAEALLKQFVQDKPQDLKLKSRLAAYYNAHKRDTDAEAVLKEIAMADIAGADGQGARLQLAQSALRRGDVTATASYLEEVLKANPDNAEALMLRAGMRMDEKNLDGAMADLQRILVIRPNADRAMLLLAQAYLQKDDTAAAETQWRKILEISPGNVQALAPLVAQMRRRGEDGLAETLVEKALKASPANPAIAELLVQIKVAKQDWVGAQSVVDTLKKQPQAAIGAELMNGMLAAARGRHADAIKSFKEVLAKQPKADQAISGLYQAYNAAGQQKELIAFLQGFVKKEPDSMAAYNALALAYAADKNWTDAEKVLQQALQRQPKALATLSLLADVLRKQGKTSETEALFKDAIAKAPDDAQLQMELAKHYEQSQKPDEAIAIYQALADKYPNNNEVANNLADLLINHREDQASIQQAVKLVELLKGNENPYFLDTFGWTMLKAGQVESALAALKKSASAVPELAAIRYHLGVALYQSGDKAAAAQELKKALELGEQQGGFNEAEKARELLQSINAAG